MATTLQTGTAHTASAKALNLAISTKHCIEISRALRYKNTSYAKRFLEDVVTISSPVPFKKFRNDIGHKAGMASGRFPQKAAKEFLRLVKSVEGNAQEKGLDTSNLKIIKILANKASIPQTGGRQRHGTKRSHIEIAVKEGKAVGKKIRAKKAIKVETVKTPRPKVKAAFEEKKVELKAEVKAEELVVEEEAKKVKVEPEVTEDPKEEAAPEAALEESKTEEKSESTESQETNEEKKE
jgi:large subunit ribosomal protein L22